MTVAEFLIAGEDKLKIAGIASARLDVLIILEDGLGKDRSWLLANQNEEISAAKFKQLGKTLGLRIGHRPLAYIRGFTEFYGHRFFVNESVLQPRPESETMIELLLDLVESRKSKVENWVVADIGTGSGALAITAKLELPNAEVVGVDIDPECLVVARKNAKQLKTKIKFFRGDLLSPIPYPLFPNVILANLPYVPRNVRINQSAAMEPKLAIDGGSDGLDVYRRFFDQLNTLKSKPRYILTESLPPQHSKLTQIASYAGYKLIKTTDFIQQFVVVSG